MNDWQGDLALFQVGAQGLSCGFLIAFQIQKVIRHLEGHTQGSAIGIKRRANLFVGPGINSHQTAGGSHQFCRLAFDDFHVICFGQ